MRATIQRPLSHILFSYRVYYKIFDVLKASKIHMNRMLDHRPQEKEHLALIGARWAFLILFDISHATYKLMNHKRTLPIHRRQNNHNVHSIVTLFTRVKRLFQSL